MSTISSKFSLENAVRPGAILDGLPQIKKARIALVTGDEQSNILYTDFNGYYNDFGEGNIKIPIKTVKSTRYSELDHRYTFETVVNELDKMHENLSIHRFVANGDYSVVRTSIIMEKPFKLSEVPFEFNLKEKPRYAEGGEKKVDFFYPMITVTNSFLGCSEVTFDLYRKLCGNGMYIGKVLSKTIKFRHFGDVIKQFNNETEKFITSIFEKKFINSLYEKYQGIELSKDDFTKFISQQLGKRIGKDINEDGIFKLPKNFSSWTGLQVLTYYTTHNVKNQDKSVKSLDAFVSLLERDYGVV